VWAGRRKPTENSKSARVSKIEKLFPFLSIKWQGHVALTRVMGMDKNKPLINSILAERQGGGGV
jgi:hypothetical protein